MNKINRVHPTTIGDRKATKRLGVSLGELRYDLLVDVLQGLHTELLRQRDGDTGHGRTRLAETLNDTADSIAAAVTSLKKTVAICQHFIDEEKKESR